MPSPTPQTTAADLVGSVGAADPTSVTTWLEARRPHMHALAHRVPLTALTAWDAGAEVDRIRRHDGAFFSIVGTRFEHGAAPPVSMPMILQRETGILGVLTTVSEDGRLRVLMQAKAEPGTVGGLQLSPTVQATESNYERRHGGRRVPMVAAFGSGADIDVLQSEHGARFVGKRNRNVVTRLHTEPAEVTDDPTEDMRWFTLGDLHLALGMGDLINADTRTVLATWYAARADQLARGTWAGAIASSIAASLDPRAPRAHSDSAVLTWLARSRRSERALDRVPLPALPGWSRRDGALVHEHGGPFEVIGVRTRARGREVAAWDQPMIAETTPALLGLLVAEIGGVLHVLLRSRAEPGLVEVVEVGPTVQTCAGLTGDDAPAAIAAAIADEAADILVDVVLSGEGGRFFRSAQRHRIVRVQAIEEPPGHRWVALHQLAMMIARGATVTEQARSLFTCLLSLLTPRP